MGVTKQANVCVGLPGSLLQLCQTKLYMEWVAVGIKHRFAAQFGCAPGGQVAAPVTIPGHLQNMQPGVQHTHIFQIILAVAEKKQHIAVLQVQLHNVQQIASSSVRVRGDQ